MPLYLQLSSFITVIVMAGWHVVVLVFTGCLFCEGVLQVSLDRGLCCRGDVIGFSALGGTVSRAGRCIESDWEMVLKNLTSAEGYGLVLKWCGFNGKSKAKDLYGSSKKRFDTKPVDILVLVASL